MPEEFFQKALPCWGVADFDSVIRFGLRNPRKKKKKKKKLRFRMNFDGNLNAVDSEGVTSIALILK